MSYEGYERYLCRKGHTWCVDAMEILYVWLEGDYNDQPKCPTCEEPAIWARSVDEIRHPCIRSHQEVVFHPQYEEQFPIYTYDAKGNIAMVTYMPIVHPAYYANEVVCDERK